VLKTKTKQKNTVIWTAHTPHTQFFVVFVYQVTQCCIGPNCGYLRTVGDNENGYILQFYHHNFILVI